MSDYGFSIDFRGFREFLSSLNAGPQAVDRAKKRILDELTIEAQSRAQREAPRRTSILANSITRNVSNDEGRVGTNISYARYQEYGTRPHVITVRRAKVLTDGKGHFFGRRVMHPGFQGKFFMKKGLEEARAKLDSIFGKVKQDIIKSLSFSS